MACQGFGGFKGVVYALRVDTLPHVKRRLFIPLLLMGLVAAALPAAAAPQDIRLELSPIDALSAPQGAPFHYRLQATNEGPELEAVHVTFRVFPKDAPEKSTDLEIWYQTAQPGQTVTFIGSVNPARWFSERGEFVLEAAQTEGRVASLDFGVSRSLVRLPRFKDVTAETGTAADLPAFNCGDWAAGAAWGDVEGDGDLDLYVPQRGQGRVGKLLISNAGTFVDQAAARGVADGGSPPAGLGASFVDYDNDGDQDLYVNRLGPNRFYENDGEGFFEEISEAAGVDDDGSGQSSSWGDYNNDGFVDLYVSNHKRCEGSVFDQAKQDDRFYRNNGDGTFSDVTELLPLPEEWSSDGAGFQLTFVDYDLDGDLDMFLANDFFGPDPRPNVLWRNDGPGPDGWVFTDVSIPANMSVKMNSMGTAVSDFDRDGDLDLAVSNIRGPALFDNQGTLFQNINEEVGIDRDKQDAGSLAITWGSISGDWNNDGWDDLFFPAGRLGSRTFQPNILYANGGRAGIFYDLSAASGMNDPSTSRGVALADYDDDGRLDMYVANQEGSPKLWRNTTKRRDAHWLKVDTIGRVSNRDGCGALLIAKVGRAKLMRQVFCGGVSLASSSDHTVHFGLGKKKRVRKLVVKWPSGLRSVKRDFRVDRTLKVREPKG